MIFELCPTLSRDLIKREFLNTAAAFGVLVLLGLSLIHISEPTRPY